MFETLGLLANGFTVVFEPQNLMLIIGGCALGLFIGAMPGLGSVNGVAILLPLTFLVPPTGAIIFLAAIYYGAMYGAVIYRGVKNNSSKRDYGTPVYTALQDVFLDAQKHIWY